MSIYNNFQINIDIFYILKIQIFQFKNITIHFHISFSNFDATTISETLLTGVNDAFKANHVEDSIESKGIKG